MQDASLARAEDVGDLVKQCFASLGGGVGENDDPG